MDEATEHVRALARRVVDAALELGPLRGALLAGSGARGDADSYSDVDLLLYADELPPEDRLDRLQEALGGANPVPIAPPHLVQFDIGGVAVQVGYSTVEQMGAELDGALVRLEEIIGSPNQKMLSGLLEGLPLYGDELIGRWRDRVAAYPDELGRASIEHHWRFFPLWFYGDAMALRDSELWRLDMLLEGAFNLLGVLAALNRVYYARFELKRLRKLVAKLALAPPDLADRLESLFRVPPSEAADDSAASCSRRASSSSASCRTSSCRSGDRRAHARSHGSRSSVTTSSRIRHDFVVSDTGTGPVRPPPPLNHAVL